MSDEADASALDTARANPQTMAADGLTVGEHSLPDQMKALDWAAAKRHKAGQATAGKSRVQFGRFKPGSATE